MKDVDSEVPLAPRAKRTANAPTPAPTEHLTVASFYAEGRALIDARKTHLARVGIGAPEAPSTPPVAGAQELPSQRKMLSMDAHEAAVELPEHPREPPAAERQGTYKPKRVPADAVNYEA